MVPRNMAILGIFGTDQCAEYSRLFRFGSMAVIASILLVVSSGPILTHP